VRPKWERLRELKDLHEETAGAFLIHTGCSRDEAQLETSSRGKAGECVRARLAIPPEIGIDDRTRQSSPTS